MTAAKPKHILIITYNDYPVYEGLGVRIRNMARVLIENGHQVSIYAPNIEHLRPVSEWVDGVRIVRSNIFVPGFLKRNRVVARTYSMVLQFFLSLLAYLRHFRGRKIDLIISAHIYSIPAAIVLRGCSGAKIYVDDIITVADALRDAGYRSLVGVFTAFERLLFRFCTEFIYTSETSRRYYLERGATPRIYLPNGVNCDEFTVKATLNAKKVVFFNGSTYSTQNTAAAENFIQIGRELMQQGQTAFRFKLVCWPKYYLPAAVQEALVTESSWLEFEEGVEKIENEIAKADIVLLPYNAGHHLSGGVRLKALEYMAASKMLISTEEGVEGISGLLHGEHFWLAEDISAVPSLIATILQSPTEMERMAKNARIHVQNHYDWRTTMVELIARIQQN